MADLQGELVKAISRARLPAGANRLRMADFGINFTKLADRLANMSADQHAEFVSSGRGWVVQGEPVKALRATHALLRTMLLLGENVFYADGLTSALAKPYDDGREEFEEADVFGIGRFYDRSYPAYPFSPADRFAAEAAVLEALHRNCTPVLHCSGRLADCDWYSGELMAMIAERCEVITVGK